MITEPERDGAIPGEGTLQPLAALARQALPGVVEDQDHVAGRQRLERSLSRTARRRFSRLWVVGAAGAFAAAAVTVRVFQPAGSQDQSALSYRLDGASASETGYVRAPDGGARIRFSDGSEVALAGAARGRIASVTSNGARLALESGRASVRIVPRQGARWAVDAGPFAVTVTGTVFDVAWSGSDGVLEVVLREGAVRVHGGAARQGVDLRAGQRLIARTGDGKLHIDDSGIDKPGAEPEAEGLPEAVAPTGTSAARAPSGWPRRVAAGDYRGVVADAFVRGIDDCVRRCPLADLVALADAARYSGEASLASRMLRAQRARFPHADDARAAAFLLGRLAEDATGAPSSAVAWYSRYLAEAPGGPFASEALGRKMMAERRLSAGEPARASAAAYLDRFPRGPYAPLARDLLANPAREARGIGDSLPVHGP